MPLLPHVTPSARAGLFAAAMVAGAFGVLVSALRGDWGVATLIGAVMVLLLVVWIWTGRDEDGE